ncbi:MAG: hypothetical protein CSA95_08500 [Bacteroidetes bacterium]|nr:MAG: hypothetical protein CSA95_08500 [Bacteroidota bacterium]PIE88080.1 MAG: hypothetical protein CSA04_03730 [Bacteroidota bacterium]
MKIHEVVKGTIETVPQGVASNYRGSCPSLNEELDTILNDFELLDLKMKLDALKKPAHTRFLGMRRMIKNPYWRYSFVAASLGLLITAGSLLLTPRSYSSEQMFDRYYHPENVMIVGSTVRGEGDMNQALVKFREGDYEEATLMFEEGLAQDPANVALRFYGGISYIETARYDDAIKSFKAVLDHKDNLYVEHAEWYLAMCYLKESKPLKAIYLLQKISDNEDNLYWRDAEKVLKGLKRPS